MKTAVRVFIAIGILALTQFRLIIKDDPVPKNKGSDIVLIEAETAAVAATAATSEEETRLSPSSPPRRTTTTSLTKETAATAIEEEEESTTSSQHDGAKPAKESAAAKKMKKKKTSRTKTKTKTTESTVTTTAANDNNNNPTTTTIMTEEETKKAEEEEEEQQQKESPSPSQGSSEVSGKPSAEEEEITSTTTTTTTAATTAASTPTPTTTTTTTISSETTTTNNAALLASSSSPTGIENNNVTVSIAVIASMQRSSSTFLSKDVLGGLPCHISMNEVLFSASQQAGDAWRTEGRQMGLKKQGLKSAHHNDYRLMATFVLRVAQRRCKEAIESGKKQFASCHNHCWANYKHFSDHMREEQHVPYWQELYNQNKHTANNPRDSFAMIVLERNVHDRWRSQMYARYTGDWNVKGGADHKAKLAAAKIPPTRGSYKKRHSHWYQKARSFANATDIHTAEITYDILTGQLANVTQQFLLHALIQN